jgi:hypothetical protein
MGRRDPLLRREITEHPGLLGILERAPEIRTV